jgi:hypothetical protein
MESHEPATPLSARDIDELLGVEREYLPLTPEQQAVEDARSVLGNAFADTMQVLDQMSHPDVVAAQRQLDAALEAEARSRGAQDSAA